MQESCPHCGSTDLVIAELGNDDSDTTYDCEECGERVRADEV